MATLTDNVFGLLKEGISRKYDAEQREQIVIREPDYRNEMNDAGTAQRLGSVESNPIGGMPSWAQYTLIGSGLLLGAAVILKAAS